MQTTTPNIVVTNYQQYINAGCLQQEIARNIDLELDGPLPETLHVSIAYVDIIKVPRPKTPPVQPAKLYKTVLALSIKGVTRRYTLMHSGEELYIAKKSLNTNQYEYASKDACMRILQQAFETIVFMRGDKITNDLVNNYKTV